MGGVSGDFAKVGELTGIYTAKRSWDGTGVLPSYWERGLQQIGKVSEGCGSLRHLEGSEETGLGTRNKKD